MILLDNFKSYKLAVNDKNVYLNLNRMKRWCGYKKFSIHFYYYEQSLYTASKFIFPETFLWYIPFICISHLWKIFCGYKKI